MNKSKILHHGLIIFIHMATQTANGRYQYAQLDDVIQSVHKIQCIENNWTVSPLPKGTFGYDNMAMCCAWVLSAHEDDVEYLSDLVHRAWIENYIYWRDHQPWLLPNSPYIKPFNPLGDDRRELCARTPYADLHELEKTKDRQIVTALGDYYIYAYI
jgi:hypothetical protein